MDWIQGSNIFRLKFPYPWLIKKVDRKKTFFKDLKILKKKKIDKKISAFFLETYQGYGAIFYPKDYVQELSNGVKKKKFS